MTAIEQALESLHQSANAIFRHALDEARIDSAFDRHLHFEGNKLIRPLTGDASNEIDLKAYRRIFAVAIGKAAVPMLEILLKRMDRRQGLRGICCSNQMPEHRNWRIRYFEGGHPLPTEGSFAAARATLALLKKARKDTLVIFLLSGGASALFDLPQDPDITLEDTMAFHQALIGSGAPIGEINTIRKHFSAVKGGRLALASAEATKLSILLPDVPMRKLDVLASGPTYPDHTTIQEARELIIQYNLSRKFPPAINTFFDQQNRGAATEPSHHKSLLSPFLPKLRKSESTESELTPIHQEDAFKSSTYEVLLSSRDLVDNATTAAQNLGYHTVIDNSCDDWDYADCAAYLLKRFHEIRAEHPRCCLISGGEVTVQLNANPGAGGRNMQFALECATDLARHPSERLLVFSAGSDGIDGNTRSAGAIVDPTTLTRARLFGYDPAKALLEFDACPLLTAIGDTVVTGPTGHNLRDLRLLISDPA